MNEHGDKGGRSDTAPQDRSAGDAPPGDETRIAWMRGALRAAIALVAAIAAAASIPYWGGDDFPIASLVIYVAGMVFVAMPLCLYYESLLQARERRKTRNGERHPAKALAHAAVTGHG